MQSERASHSLGPSPAQPACLLASVVSAATGRTGAAPRRAGACGRVDGSVSGVKGVPGALGRPLCREIYGHPPAAAAAAAACRHGPRPPGGRGAAGRSRGGRAWFGSGGWCLLWGVVERKNGSEQSVKDRRRSKGMGKGQRCSFISRLLLPLQLCRTWRRVERDMKLASASATHHTRLGSNQGARGRAGESTGTLLHGIDRPPCVRKTTIRTSAATSPGADSHV